MCEFLVVCFAVFIQCVCDAFAFATVYFFAWWGGSRLR